MLTGSPDSVQVILNFVVREKEKSPNKNVENVEKYAALFLLLKCFLNFCSRFDFYHSKTATTTRLLQNEKYK